MTETLTIFITAGLEASRLDRALVEAWVVAAPSQTPPSRAGVQRLIKAGLVARAGNAALDASDKVHAGEVYTVTLLPPEPALPEAQAMPLRIVYEDADLLVVDKPAGLVVHPAAGNRDRTLVNALLAHCGDSLSGIGGVARPGIVHRLDKDTSGLMVVAKHDAAHQALSRQFADRSLSRVYQALVWGALNLVAGSVEGAIGRHPRDRKKMAVVRHGGKAALTHYKLVERLGAGATTASLIECKLATGRTHQIRVHMAHIGHPLVGDPTYGRGGKVAGFSRQALHAAELTFIHPRTGKAMRFTTPMPKDMATLLESWPKRADTAIPSPSRGGSGRGALRKGDAGNKNVAR